MKTFTYATEKDTAQMWPSREPEGNLTSSLSTQTSALPPPARKPASKPPAVNQVERATATPPAASSKGKSRVPRQAAKATPET
ncbi:hypothetical protein F444_10549 [Phytophthora nicotianae P1976]|uniref:Uncharacterized protein n=1 Tax=Phytophthora nicotianae P1976 TaxID=1317066 RepID=A0A081A3P9_PHYNI|nr:hypothetical protein F444_10549 [Phytophthora nicotianae P1976]